MIVADIESICILIVLTEFATASGNSFKSFSKFKRLRRGNPESSNSPVSRLNFLACAVLASLLALTFG